MEPSGLGEVVSNILPAEASENCLAASCNGLTLSFWTAFCWLA